MENSFTFMKAFFSRAFMMTGGMAEKGKSTQLTRKQKENKQECSYNAIFIVKGHKALVYCTSCDVFHKLI